MQQRGKQTLKWFLGESESLPAALVQTHHEGTVSNAEKIIPVSKKTFCSIYLSFFIWNAYQNLFSVFDELVAVSFVERLLCVFPKTEKEFGKGEIPWHQLFCQIVFC